MKLYKLWKIKILCTTRYISGKEVCNSKTCTDPNCTDGNLMQYKNKCHRFWSSSYTLEISLWSLPYSSFSAESQYSQLLLPISLCIFYICLFLVISTVVYPFVLICCPCRALVSSANSTLLTNRSVCYINHAFISIIKSEKHDNYLSMEKVMMTIIKHFLKRLTWKYPIH